MTANNDFDIFLATAPGLEQTLCAEAHEKGFKNAKATAGGVTVRGCWHDVWRANLKLRGAARVTASLGSFRAEHLSQLDKRSRKFPWGEILRKDVAFRVEASCKSSRIYHSGAAVERVERAIREELGAPQSDAADVCVRVRIENDVVNLGVDTSGELLHKRGYKEAVNVAPMRETFAAMFLRQCGYKGSEPVLDPMCGSGTFVIEAAEIAAGLYPGRSRSFAFEQLATFDAAAWTAMRGTAKTADTPLRFYGTDRDAGAIRMSRENAARAGIESLTSFEQFGIEDLKPPEGPQGLVIANPPYGERIAGKNRAERVYRAFGETMRTRFQGWRIAIITTDAALAKATGLPFKPPGKPVSHGGLRVSLFQSGVLG
jgi:putative N6-adenine-specific DNA methylase